MYQLSLFDFDQQLRAGDHGVDNNRLTDPVNLMEVFRTARLAEGAHPRTVAREISQIRAVARECRALGGRDDLIDVFADLVLIAKALAEPTVPIARSTGQTRLVATQRFLRITSSYFGRNADHTLSRLDALLPGTRTTTWHTAGTLVAGTRRRRRQRSPVLGTQELHRILHAARHGRDTYATRNRALVAMHCFSGLRPEEIVTLTWRQLKVTEQDTGYDALSACVIRNDKSFELPLPRQTAEPLMELARSHGAPIETLTGPVFRPHHTSHRSLSYRSARDIVKSTCNRAGFPLVEAVDMRAAYAHWLGTQGLSDHEVAAVLGLERVRSVDRLLKRHHALDAQRRVREMLEN